MFISTLVLAYLFCAVSVGVASVCCVVTSFAHEACMLVAAVFLVTEVIFVVEGEAVLFWDLCFILLEVPPKGLTMSKKKRKEIS